MMREVVKATVAVTLLLNIVVTAVLIQVVLTRSSYQSSEHKIADLKKTIDQEYSNTPPKNEDNEQLEIKDSRSKISQIRNWANSEGVERTLLYRGMTYQDGSITVPVAGVYHITSHVKFHVEEKKDHKSSQTFHHQIVRYSASSWKQVVLFENVVTECREGINDGVHLEYPSLTGGLAQLDAGDQVIVRVSHFDLLKHDRDWFYFDIYLL